MRSNLELCEMDCVPIYTAFGSITLLVRRLDRSSLKPPLFSSSSSSTVSLSSISSSSSLLSSTKCFLLLTGGKDPLVVPCLQPSGPQRMSCHAFNRRSFSCRERGGGRASSSAVAIAAGLLLPGFALVMSALY